MLLGTIFFRSRPPPFTTTALAPLSSQVYWGCGILRMKGKKELTLTDSVVHLACDGKWQAGCYLSGVVLCLGSLRHWNKGPQSGATRFGRPTSRCCEDHAPSEGFRETAFLEIPATGWSLAVLACDRITLPLTFIFIFLMCLSLNSLFFF